VLMILLGANLCSGDVATSHSQPAGSQGGGGVARYASCCSRSEWHCGLRLGARRNVASALLNVWKLALRLHRRTRSFSYKCSTMFVVLLCQPSTGRRVPVALSQHVQYGDRLMI
jgi:hypothetical protein